MNAEQKIINALSPEWKSTNTIAKESGINWYRAEHILEGQSPDLVEKDKKPDATYWRLKQ
jgi:predicted DNA-binding ArsR family transcriptional regulator